MAFVWTAALILTSPRLGFFDEQRLYSRDTNTTLIADIKCKPVDATSGGYAVFTLALFVLGYAFPAVYVIYATARARLFMWKRRKSVHILTTQNVVMRHESRLLLTFSLTAAWFLIIWTPYFLLSALDVELGLLERRELAHVNFSLRCTLLLLGSAKPLVYLACLPAFRAVFSCRRADTEEPPPLVIRCSTGATSANVPAVELGDSTRYHTRTTKL